MKGHQSLIAMRRDGVAPALVFVDTEDLDFADHPWFTDQPTVWIPRTDNLRRLDLRCFVGLTLSVTGDDAERVAEVVEASRKAGAARVIAVAFVDNRVSSLTDTAEA